MDRRQLVDKISKSLTRGQFDVVSMARSFLDKKWRPSLQKMGYNDAEIDDLLKDALDNNNRVTIPRLLEKQDITPTP